MVDSNANGSYLTSGKESSENSYGIRNINLV